MNHIDTPAAETLPSAAVGFQAEPAPFAPTVTDPPSIRFAEAIIRVEADRLREGIGTLGEKTLHAVLKYFYEPDPACHERKIGSYFADVERDGNIVEIQTRQLYRLEKKLESFLQRGYQVTVVHPIPRNRWLYWIGEDGTLSPRRKSPKTGRLSAAAPELAALHRLIGDPGLTFSILLLDVEDFRNLNGWSKDKKKGSTRFERMPVAYVDELTLRSPEDFRQILPEGLPSPFTAAEFYKKGGYPVRGGFYALKLFEQLGIVRKIGTKGKAFLFEVCECADE